LKKLGKKIRSEEQRKEKRKNFSNRQVVSGKGRKREKGRFREGCRNRRNHIFSSNQKNKNWHRRERAGKKKADSGEKTKQENK
jgi:hypothetical protein